jgi:hypothetical protein
MRTDPHSRQRVRLPSRTTLRRDPCRTQPWPTRLGERFYIGHADASGVWSLYAGGELLMITAGRNSARLLATAMLADAFPGRKVREDLIDAFVAAWTPAGSGFVLPAELVAGWSLRWALEQADP